MWGSGQVEALILLKLSKLGKRLACLKAQGAHTSFKLQLGVLIHWSVCLTVCQSVCLSVILSVCLSFFLSVFMSFCIVVCLFVCLSKDYKKNISKQKLQKNHNKTLQNPRNVTEFEKVSPQLVE